MIGIYRITNKINGKSYIGQSVNIEERFKHHKKYRRKDEDGKLLYRSINKYGIENFSFEIIDICKKEELDEKEIYYIKKYESFKNGYNMTKGGESLCGYTFSKKSIQKRVKSVKNYYSKNKRSAESREKVRKSLIEFYKNNPDARKKIGESSRGRRLSKEAIEKMKETKRKNCCGEKTVFQYNPNGGYVGVYKSVKVASDSLKICQSAISDVCRGKRKSAGGFIWSYKLTI